MSRHRLLNRLSNMQLLQVLLAKYKPQGIPSCPVCGDELKICSMSGRETSFGCPSDEEDSDRPVNQPDKIGRYLGDQHFADSRWTDRSEFGDPAVIELMYRFYLVHDSLCRAYTYMSKCYFRQPHHGDCNSETNCDWRCQHNAALKKLLDRIYSVTEDGYVPDYTGWGWLLSELKKLSS